MPCRRRLTGLPPDIASLSLPLAVLIVTSLVHVKVQCTYHSHLTQVMFQLLLETGRILLVLNTDIKPYDTSISSVSLGRCLHARLSSSTFSIRVDMGETRTLNDWFSTYDGQNDKSKP